MIINYTDGELSVKWFVLCSIIVCCLEYAIWGYLYNRIHSWL